MNFPDVTDLYRIGVNEICLFVFALVNDVETYYWFITVRLFEKSELAGSDYFLDVLQIRGAIVARRRRWMISTVVSWLECVALIRVHHAIVELINTCWGRLRCRILNP